MTKGKDGLHAFTIDTCPNYASLLPYNLLIHYTPFATFFNQWIAM
jgi:hypothetical protein